MTVSSPNRYRHALEKLAAEPPRTKTALLRLQFLPKIERALTFGKTSKQVCQYWVEEGLEIDYSTFHRLFPRVRMKFNATATANGKSAELASPHFEEWAGVAEYNPLANLRRAEANGPAIDKNLRR